MFVMLSKLDEISFYNFINEAMEFKREYNALLSPFFNKFKIIEWKEHVYKMRMEPWKKDKIWEFLNGDISFNDLLIYDIQEQNRHKNRKML